MPDVRVDTSVRVPRGVDDLRPSRAAAVPSTRSHRLLFIGYDNGGDAHLLRLRGLLDLRTAGLLAAALGELERASAFDVVLDLDAVTSCDGTALAVILGGARRLERARPPAADRGRERCRLCRDGEDPDRKAPLSRRAGPPGAGRLSPIAPRRTSAPTTDPGRARVPAQATACRRRRCPIDAARSRSTRRRGRRPGPLRSRSRPLCDRRSAPRPR